MAREQVVYRASSMIRYIAPTDVINQVLLDNTNEGSTCSFKVFDPAKNERISADEAASQVELSVTNAEGFQVDDQVEIELDDATVLITTVSSIDPVAGTITVADGLTSQASERRRVRRSWGSAVTMTEFGTPAFGRRDWGFQGTFASNHAAQILDQEVDIEISFVGAVAGGLDDLEVVCGVITQVQDCD